MNQTQTPTQQMDLELELELDPLDDFDRVPGLLRRWEIEQVVTSGAEYRIEEAGELSDKTQVFAVYRREHTRARSDSYDGVPVGLTFGNQQVSVRARLLPINGGEPPMAILVIGDNPEDAATLARVRTHLARSTAPIATGPDDRRTATTAAGQEGATP
jgi:hypothetical protein